MTSPKLQILARQMARHQQPERVPAPTNDLAATLEALIQERVDAALERQPVKPPARVQQVIDQFDKPKPYTSFDQIEPPPKAPSPKAREMHFQRDELGRINRVNVGNMQWVVQRDQLGQIIRMVPSDLVPPPPAIEPPALAASRAYQLGEPR